MFKRLVLTLALGLAGVHAWPHPSGAGTARGVPAALRGGPYRAPGPCTLCRVVGS